MARAQPLRRDDQPAFVLHTYAYRETSVIVEAFTAEYGRVAVVARGARRPRSDLRGLLQAFQPLLLSWSGQAELKTLLKAEWRGGLPRIGGSALLCGFYLNELLLKLLPREDPHPRLYATYEAALAELAAGSDEAPVLRRFELLLLAELGYALPLAREADTGNPMGGFEIPGMPGANIGVMNLNDMLSKAMGGRTKTRKTSVKESYAFLINDESDKLLDQDEVVRRAMESAENDGIVFIDEIDKVATRDGGVGAGVSREGVQRDLLPLVEGTTVATKYGSVKTDHILFIASGAFHMAKPSDLLPELQGRLPIRVELRALEKEDFRRILTETEASLIKQYIALMLTEGVTLDFTDDAIDRLAAIAVDLNASVENIGARRLQTVMERVLDEISYEAPDKGGTSVTIDAAYVDKHVGDLAKNTDLSRFIL